MSPPEVSHQYNDNYDMVQQNSNYIIILNGIILTAYITILTKLLPGTESILNMTYIHNASPETHTVNFVSYDSNVSILLPLLHLFTIAAIFGSILWCVGAVDRGVLVKRDRDLSTDSELELRKREKNILVNYRGAVVMFVAGVLGVYAISFSLFFPISTVFLLYVVIIAVQIWVVYQSKYLSVNLDQ